MILTALLRLPPALLCTLVLAPLGYAQGTTAGPGIGREQMWPAPTAEDWERPCLITWQRTYEDAVAVSKETGKPLLVCVNMDGEIASEHYAGIRYRQPEIVKLYEPYVTVIASVYRHTPRDHDEAGNRILCPRFGSVTCGEHITIEPIIFEKFLDGKRIAPRHIMVELDGRETYDVYYAWDTASVFKAISDGIGNRPDGLLRPAVRGDRSIIERVSSPDIRDRIAVETAYKEGDASLRQALLDAAKDCGDRPPTELLRLAIFGLDVDLGRRGRQALAQSSSGDSIGLISEALRTPIQEADRAALVAALDRIGENDPLARALAVVQRGLGDPSKVVDMDSWAKGLSGGGSYAPPDDAVVRASLEKLDHIAASEDPTQHLDLADAFLTRALEADEGLTSDRMFASALYQDAQAAAQRAAQLGAKGWRVDAPLAIAAYCLGDTKEAYARAEKAMGDIPAVATSLPTLIVLGVFAESRHKAIADAVQKKKEWPGQWLTDVHAAYDLLARHPLGDASQVVAHYDFLRWLGGHGEADRVLEAGLARFPESPELHARFRTYVLHDKGAKGLETAYDTWLQKSDAPPSLSAFAGYSALVGAEFHRRARRYDDSIAAYDRGAKHYERAIEVDPDNKDTADHFIAMAHGGRARVAFERRDDERALHEILASFERRPASAATLDGLTISTVDTAKMLLARLERLERTELAAQLKGALSKLDPALLELPAYERDGSDGNRRGQGRRPRNRPDR